MNAEQLKSSILQQAIAGKLVPQCASEGGVKQLGNVSEDVPYDLPANWKWIKADLLLEFVRGITFPASAKNRDCLPGMIRCLTTGSVQKEHNSSSDVFVSSSYVKKERQYLKKNDIVISSANSRELVGKSILWSETEKNVAFGGFLTVARVKEESVDATYAFYVFQALFSLRYFENLSTQTTNIANLSNTLLSNILFPIPPICEQARIVAKIQELLPLVEAYGKSYDRLQELNAELPGKLKASILQEAIQGKLVPQLDSEEAVEQVGDAPENVPFAIPEKWKWVKIKSVFTMQAGKFISASSIRTEGKVPCYGGNGLRGYVDEANRNGHFPLIGRQGALCGNVHVVNGEFYATEHAVVVDCGNYGDPECVGLFLKAMNLNQYATATAQPGLSVKKIVELPFPLPPKSEQVRIASKVKELMKQVETLSGLEITS